MTRASPLYADGNIYLACRNGTITVVKAGRKFEEVWQTSLDDSITSSPVIANGPVIYLGFQHRAVGLQVVVRLRRKCHVG